MVKLALALPPAWLMLKPPPMLCWCDDALVVSCCEARFRLPPTFAVTLPPLTCAPSRLVSPPDTMVTLSLPVTWVLLWMTASLLESPCALLIEADTPKPLVPYEIPTLADDELFSLRVLSVSWLETRLTALAAPSTTSFAETPLPATVRLPVPATGLPLASLAPVAISVALPPAISVLP